MSLSLHTEKVKTFRKHLNYLYSGLVCTQGHSIKAGVVGEYQETLKHGICLIHLSPIDTFLYFLTTEINQGHSCDSSNFDHNPSDLLSSCNKSMFNSVRPLCLHSNKWVKVMNRLRKTSLLLLWLFGKRIEALSHAWQRLQALTQASFSVSTFPHIKQGFVPL